MVMCQKLPVKEITIDQDGNWAKISAKFYRRAERKLDSKCLKIIFTGGLNSRHNLVKQLILSSLRI